MKHSEIKQGFKSPYMTKVAERLSVIKMSSEERNEYIYYQKQSVHSQDILNAAEAKGEAKGRVEGIYIGEARGEKNKAVEIAKIMLSKNNSVEEIVELTGLSKDDVARILLNKNIKYNM